jgi:hypothetical protein
LLNCFLAITDSEQVAQQVSYLLTSRYPTTVIRIDRASNYKHNLIDNSVCELWTLANKHDISTFRYYENQKKLVEAESLIPVSTKIIDWDIDMEKQWIFLCLHWVIFFETLESQYYYFKIDNFLKPLLNDKINYYPDQFRKETLTELYLETDFEHTDRVLADKIREHKELYPFWKTYMDSRV